MTIEERANEKYCDRDGYVIDMANDYKRIGYIEGATEQEKITIDKACEWLKNNGYLATNGWYTIKGTLEDFRKYMEE